MVPLYLSFLSPTDHTTVQGPNWACRALPMAELPLLPWAPPLARVVPKTHLCPQLSGRAEDLAPECSRLLVVPSIHITPSSDGESSPCTPPPRRLQLLRIPDLESPPQDRSDWVLGWKRGYFSLGTHAQGWGTEGQSVAGGQLAPQELGCKLGNSSTNKNRPLGVCVGTTDSELSRAVPNKSGSGHPIQHTPCSSNCGS